MGLGRLMHRAQISSIAGWLVFLAGMLLLLAWAGLSIALVSDQMSRNPEGGTPWIGAVVLSVFFVPLGLIFTFKGLSGRVLRIDVHEGGIAYRAAKERRTLLWDHTAAVLWEEMEHVAELGFGMNVAARSTAKTTLHPFGDAPIVVDERFPDHVRLAAYVRDAAAAGMLPRFEAALYAGQRVSFGNVGLDGWGLYLPEAVAWDQVASVRWQSLGQRARYVVTGPDGSHIADIPCPLPNEVIFQVLLKQKDKLGGALDDAPSLGSQLLASARALMARHLPNVSGPR